MTSSSFIKKWHYGVFLSFRGLDTRNTFTGHLNRALCDKGVNVFIDNELKRGEVIASQLLRVIEESRISIVVLSENYASSSFCLDELAKILECKEFKSQTVIPVFYHVDPTDVEEQTGTFGEKFTKLESQLKNQNWRLALTKVATLSGFHLKEGDHEATTVQSIVKLVLKQLDNIPLHVPEHAIGLASRVNDILKELNMESVDVRMLGLYGMGGVGKTITAKALYNKCISEFEFDGSCFLLNVREKSKKDGFAQLQQDLLFQILGDKKHLSGSFDEGIELVKERLCGKKVLIFIDDVDAIEQLKKLAGGLNWFGAGSRIIVTTRDLRLLKAHGITRLHEIEKLKDDDSLKLFTWHAFKESKPNEVYKELLRLVVKYAQGLPLALEVLGSFLYGRNEFEWKEVLEQLDLRSNKKISDILEVNCDGLDIGMITHVLKISYDGLSKEEKAIFLDIAFFLKGKNKDEVTKFLKACGFNGYNGVQRLIEKSLIYEFEELLEMHDLLKEMGIQIALENSSRLCIQKRMDIQVLLKNKRLYDAEILLLDFHGDEEVHLNFLEKLIKLRVLVIRNGHFIKIPKKLPNCIRWLEWPNCPSKSISPQFLPANLLVLEIPCSSIQEFFGDKSKAQNFMNLTHMNFRHCEYLRKTVDFSAIPNLEVLDLFGCKKLEKISKSIGSLKKLKSLELGGCKSLKSLPNLSENQGLVSINIDDCSKLKNLPNLPMSLENLWMDNSGIKEIPAFVGYLVNLSELNASNCKNLTSVSNTIYSLGHRTTLWLRNCPKLLKLPETESRMFSSDDFPPYKFNQLLLPENSFVSLPTSTFKFSQICFLNLMECKWLVEIPELPQTVEALRAGNCKSLVRFSQFQFYYFEGDFVNCHKLAEHEMQNWRVMFPNVLLTRKEGSLYKKIYEIILPGNEIPKWFGNVIECEGNHISFTLPPPPLNHNFVGVAWCVIFQYPQPSLGIFTIHFSMRHLFIEYRFNMCGPLESEHTWLGFARIGFDLPELPAEEISCELDCYNDALVFKRVGIHYIYES